MPGTGTNKSYNKNQIREQALILMNQTLSHKSIRTAACTCP